MCVGSRPILRDEKAWPFRARAGLAEHIHRACLSICQTGRWAKAKERTDKIKD